MILTITFISIWGGPLDPSGSYNIMTEYSDGTSVHKDDFVGKNFPDNGWATQDIWGDLDYFRNQPPSSSCTSIRLGDNTIDPYAKVSGHINRNERRTIVCMGRLLNIKL